MNIKYVWICAFFLLSGTEPVLAVPPIADSVNEFSGTQGQDNWYYGYYDGDGPVLYSNPDFEELPNYVSNGPGGRGPEWYIDYSKYWTACFVDGGHPNGLITSGGHLSAEHWIVRRWISEVSGNIAIIGNLADLHGGAGDGIVGHILIDGTDVFTQIINDGDFTGVDYNVNVAVSVGSLVDFAVAPRSSDWTDGTKFTAVITPEPTTLLLLALEIFGPNEVAEDFQAQYKAIAHFDNSSTADVTDLADWSVEPNDYASIDVGLLETEEIDKPQDITITAEYTEAENTEVAQKEVSVLAICPSGSALQFDGQDDYVQVPYSEAFQLPVLTLMAWIYPTSDLSVSGGSIVGRGEDKVTDRSAFSIGVRTATSPWGHGVGVGYEVNNDDDYTYGTDYYPPVGQWAHIVAMRDTNGQLRIYANGILIGQWDSTPTPASNCYQDLTIGASWNNDRGNMVLGGFFPGIIDEVAIYNRALSAEEIQTLMHTRPDTSDPNLVAYWAFDEGEGQVAGNSSGNNGNHGQLGSTPDTDNSDPEWVESDAPVGICIPVAVDIKPGSCPNPLNLASRGVLPVAVLGSEDFDVNAIEPFSIRLSEVAPIRGSYEDVATPVTDGNECECTMTGPDGYTDLTLKFMTQEIVEELLRTEDELADGQELSLTVTGELTDGTVITGSDCVVLVGNVPKWLAAKRWDGNEDGVVNLLDLAEMAQYWLESSVVED